MLADDDRGPIRPLSTVARIISYRSMLAGGRVNVTRRAKATGQSGSAGLGFMQKFDFYGAAADERGIVRWYNLAGKLWLRGIARILEYTTRLNRQSLNLSRITDQLVVGGSIPVRSYGRLKAMGVTAVIDLREEAKDDEAALARYGIELLHLPATDRYAASQDQLQAGAAWAMDRIKAGGQVYAHCRHGVGRGPLMGLAIMVAQGETSSSALRRLRSMRWQAAPNDRQLAALLEFERSWTGHEAHLMNASSSTVGAASPRPAADAAVS